MVFKKQQATQGQIVKSLRIVKLVENAIPHICHNHVNSSLCKLERNSRKVREMELETQPCPCSPYACPSCPCPRNEKQ